MNPTLVEGLMIERVSSDQRTEKRHIGKVGQQRPIAGEEQLFGVVSTKPAAVHFSFKKRTGPLHTWTQGSPQLRTQQRRPG